MVYLEQVKNGYKILVQHPKV